MSRVVTQTGSIAVNPSSYDREDHSYYSLGTTANAYTSEDSDTYSTIGLIRGSQAVTYVYFKFDTSSIPSNATITSVSCSAKTNSNASNSYAPTKQVQLFSGTTAKGTATAITNAVRTYTLSPGIWTRSELEDTRIRVYAVRGTSNVTSSRNIQFFGATLTVAYTYDTTFYTVSGSSTIPGVTVTTSEAEYSEGNTATVTISGASGVNISVMDNGVDVTSQVVSSGSDFIYTISDIDADHTIIVEENQQQRQTVMVKQNGSWITVDTIYVKQSGVWKEVDTLSIKQNGDWIN